MGKRVYLTKEVTAGGTRIKVRQVVGSGDPHVPQMIAAATVSARHWLDLVLPQRVLDPYVDIIAPTFRFCFHADPSPANINLVFTVLHTIRSALHTPFGVKVVSMSGGTLGYVSRSYTGCVQQVGGMYQYDVDDDLIHSRGEMHLASSIMRSGDTAAVTLIHEAGHKYANLRDHGWRGYFAMDYSGYEQNTLPWQQCLVNADSYAVFTYLVANPALAKRRVPGLVRSAQRTGLNQDDALAGVGNLFR